MPELNIERQHTLGLAGARAVAERWREQAEQEWGMACESVPGESEDRMRFARSGVSGELVVTERRFDLQHVLAGLNDKQVDISCQQTLGLLRK